MSLHHIALAVSLLCATQTTADGTLTRLLQTFRGLRPIPTPPNLDGHGHELVPPALWTSASLRLADVGSRGSSRTLQSVPSEDSAWEDPDPDPNPKPSRPPLRNEDFVYAAPCSEQRLQLAQASRYWRKGMRAVFITDYPADKLSPEIVASAAKYRESFAWYPNFKRMANDLRDHYLEGDRRAAMAPILAYSTLADPAAMYPWTLQPPKPRAKEAVGGSAQASAEKGAGAGSSGVDTDPFKWMLMGDDDTVFFMRGVKALLRDYDPQLPYFLSDYLYYGAMTPKPEFWDMRCTPCHHPNHQRRRAGSRRLLAAEQPKGSGAGTNGKAKGALPKGCNCNTEHLCKRRFPKNVTQCVQEWEGPVPWGGVGFIMSIGLFKAIAAQDAGEGLKKFEACVNAPNTSVMSFPEGGDAFLSRCLWRLGFPITDPGYTPWGRYMGEILHLHALYDAPTNLTRGELPKEAQQRWTNAVSMHLGQRQFKSYKAAALGTKYAVGVYDLIAEMLWPSGKPKPPGSS
ncbi:hypothetical protein HYH03_006993 [Edaphochlamys debaryana]|uniref:Glycosyltransferase family 31 protein n=1 Tax=Edaphochlamys debaryana TaxID=47281 RepID=A0A835Y195_9CHLO|nr:hypothetical protein HYH03_006993 [Edaphochlamys debaryana]|eukprot:KAG2494747.1 hypothetical protein HYH03_006993 [Edaphochlamys debaryana]